jgi:hypothetical protein
VPDATAASRPGLVRTVESLVEQAARAPGAARDLLDEVRGGGRWAGSGMVQRLADELVGMDPRQVGCALMVAGSHFSVIVDAAVPRPSVGWLGRQQRRGRGAGMPFIGTLLALVGEACAFRQSGSGGG